MSWQDVWAGLHLNSTGVMAAVLVGLVCAYLGVFVVLKRVVFVGLTLAQLSGAGIGLAFLLGPVLGALGHRYAHSVWPLSQVGTSLEWIAARPLSISLVVTLLGIWLLARHSGSQVVPRDSIVGAAYVAAYGMTLLFILRSPKGMEDVRELLDGSVIATSPADLMTLALVLGTVLVIHALFYKQNLFVAFDPEAAAAQSYRVAGWEALFYVTLGVAITVAMRQAGILLVFACLVIPPIVGLVAARRMGSVLGIALLSAGLSAILGFVLALKWDLPLSPPTIGVGLGLLAVAALARRRSPA